MSETKVGMVRRAITRADEDEVRRRVARAIGCDVSMVKVWWGRDDSVRSITYHVDASRDRGLTDGERERSGVVIGADGWEIEVRRPLPAPWRWWPGDGDEFLARADVRPMAIAIAADHAAWLYDAENGSDGIRVDASSRNDAKAKGEEHGWKRGLFGVVEDAPPVDRAQAIRDALIERLTCSPLPTMDDLLNLLNGRNGRPMVTVSEVIVALASIGAVEDSGRWRLSDGPPPGWEWSRAPLGLYLARSGSRKVTADRIAWVSNSGDVWDVTKEEEGGKEIERGEAKNADECKAAALMACRRAGLFATVEQPAAPAFPTDAGVEPPRAVTPQGPAATLREILDVVTGERTPFDSDALDSLCVRFVADLDAAMDMRVARTAPVDPAQAAASAMLQRDTIDPAWGALEARAVRAEQERDEARAGERAWKATVKLREEERDDALQSLARVTNERDAERVMGQDRSHAIEALTAQLEGARADLRSVAQSRDSFQVMYDQAAVARDMYWRRTLAAEGKLATTEKILARVTAERDEARLNVVDARAHCASWKRCAEDAEALVAAMRGVLDASPKAAT